MNSPIDIVIFDCDGVLVESEWLAARIQAELGTEMGWPLSPAEAAARFLGLSAESIRTQIAAHLGADAAHTWWERFMERYRRGVDAGLAPPVDGLTEVLDDLTVPFCVASSGSHEKIAYSLHRAGLYDRFAGRLYSATDVARGKPAPDLFLYAAEAMGADPAACAVVEDSPAGVAAARAAGMRVFARTSGLCPPSRLSGARTILFGDMRDLPGLFGRGPRHGAEE
ncbi:HAD family hydrolase [Streptomyces sp. Ac-502]|uniref:HAD family hydrolase n=1 Tax=Streptomyces sp. Ac-502 TaxID=3342801 RepID=UPI0038628ABF